MQLFDLISRDIRLRFDVCRTMGICTSKLLFRALCNGAVLFCVGCGSLLGYTVLYFESLVNYCNKTRVFVVNGQMSLLRIDFSLISYRPVE